MHIVMHIELAMFIVSLSPPPVMSVFYLCRLVLPSLVNVMGLENGLLTLLTGSGTTRGNLSDGIGKLA